MNEYNSVNINAQELDVQANQYTLKCLRITAAAFALIWVLTITGVFIVDRTMMTAAFVAGSALMLAPSLICRRVGTRRGWIKYMILLFSAAAIALISTVLTYHAVLLYALPLFYAAQYSNRRMIYYSFAMTAVSVYVSAMAGYFWGLCDANMLLLTVRSMPYYADLLLNNPSAIALNPNPWVSVPLFYVLPRCIILAVFVPVIRKISDNISKNAGMVARLRYIGETDKATRFYNRNKYIEMMDEYYPRLEKLAVIFWDINNLKEMNDSFGHAYGDSMIISIAGCIFELTDERRKVFRLGGDEFVMMLEEDEAEGVEALLERWRALLAEARASSGLPLSVAVGWARGAGRDAEQLVKQADAEMYRDKRDDKQKRRGVSDA